MTASTARRTAPPEPAAPQPTPSRGRTIAWTAALGACVLAALGVAVDAGVEGTGSVGPALRALAAGILLFGLCGAAPALLLARGPLHAWWPLLVLPLGAVTSGLALTVLGFAYVPYGLSLALVLVAGAASSLWAWRSRESQAVADAPNWSHIGAVALVAGLIAAVAVVPYFRSGFATVTGFGSDAHQVTGSALFLQNDHPAGRDPTLPIDRVQVTWRSKYPIYYPLSAVSSISGLETWEAMTPLMALLCALVATGWFLFARLTLGAALGVALLAMGLAALDRQTFHVTIHPYYNQLWGLLTLPFSLMLAREWIKEPTRGPFVLFALFTALGAFAYPLMLPFPLLSLLGFWIYDRRERRARGEDVASVNPRRLWRGARSLVWIVPLALVLLIPIAGIAEKIVEAGEILIDPRNSLVNWQGDLLHYPPIAQFFGIPSDGGAAGLLAVAAVLALAFFGLTRVPRSVGRPLTWVLVAALVAAVYFRIVPLGQYFMFKVLTFSGPILLAAAAAGIGWVYARQGRLARAGAVVAGIALSVAAVNGASDDVGGAFDQLRPDQLALAEWAEKIPEDASIRLDVDEGDQIWTAYFLAPHPLGSRRPLTVYPHVPHSRSADYALDGVLTEPPDDAAVLRRCPGRPSPRRARCPVLTNGTYRLWKLAPERRPDGTSRRQVPVFDVGSVSGG